jgi:hypothetical protein
LLRKANGLTSAVLEELGFGAIRHGLPSFSTSDIYHESPLGSGVKARARVSEPGSRQSFCRRVLWAQDKASRFRIHNGRINRAFREQPLNHSRVARVYPVNPFRS